MYGSHLGVSVYDCLNDFRLALVVMKRRLCGLALFDSDLLFLRLLSTSVDWRYLNITISKTMAMALWWWAFDLLYRFRWFSFAGSCSGVFRWSSGENFQVGDEVAPQLDTWFATVRGSTRVYGCYDLSLWTGFFFGWAWVYGLKLFC